MILIQKIAEEQLILVMVLPRLTVLLLLLREVWPLPRVLLLSTGKPTMRNSSY
jgi:hypothetical protein